MGFWFFMTICNLILPVLMIVLGKLWWKIGWSMLPLSIISMLPAIGKNDDFIGVLGAVVISVECIIMFISILFTERALAKKFD